MTTKGNRHFEVQKTELETTQTVGHAIHEAP